MKKLWISLLVWLIKKHPDVMMVSVTTIKDIEDQVHDHLETHEWAWQTNSSHLRRVCSEVDEYS